MKYNNAIDILTDELADYNAEIERFKFLISEAELTIEDNKKRIANLTTLVEELENAIAKIER